MESNEIRHRCKDGEHDARAHGDHCLGDDSNNYLWLGEKPVQLARDEKTLDGMEQQASCDLQGHEAGRKVQGEEGSTLSSVTAPDAGPKERRKGGHHQPKRECGVPAEVAVAGCGGQTPSVHRVAGHEHVRDMMPGYCPGASKSPQPQGRREPTTVPHYASQYYSLSIISGRGEAGTVS